MCVVEDPTRFTRLSKALNGASSRTRRTLQRSAAHTASLFDVKWKSCARMAGTVRTWERTYHEQPAGLLSGLAMGRRKTRGSTARLVDRPEVDPEQIRSLPTGKALVITKTPEASARMVRVAPPSRDGPER